MTGITYEAERALLNRLDELAADVGRLRRRFASNETAWTGPYVVERIADALESVDRMLRPSAAELYRVYYGVSGDEQVAVEEALEVVDRRARQLQVLLRRAG